MKRLTRIISVLMIVAIFVSALCVNTSAAVNAPTIKNTGTRDEVATSLSDMAVSYYTADYTYDVLSKKSEAELLSALRSFMTNTHTAKSSYNNCRDYAYYTDCQKGAADETVSLIYSSYTATKAQWNDGWNREHVWPKSLGDFDDKSDFPGCDMHHVRPADKIINSTRNNNKYGNVEGGAPSKTAIATSTGGYYKSGYFEPLDNVKGDVARICLYVYVRYGAEYSKCNNITNVFESVDVLLEWCELDPVDTWEMSRNDVVASVQGNRNVFIDYPEYAWLLFGEEIPADMVTPTADSRQASGDKDDDSEQTPTNPEVNPPEANDPEINAPGETNSATEESVTESAKDDVKITDKSEDDKSDDKSDDADSGCGSSVAISAICVVGIVGIAAIVKKKED